MLKKELIERSPIRVLEKSIHGGLGRGNLGAFTAWKGVGKTACLAHVALDKMLKGQNVLHLSFADNPQHIETWYRQVFEEVAASYRLDDAHAIFEEIQPHRLIIHFKQKDADFGHIRKSVQQINEGSGFNPETVIVDGLDLGKMEREALLLWKQFAEEQEAEIWFSATMQRDEKALEGPGIPPPLDCLAELFSVIILLVPKPGYIDMKLLKDRDSGDLEKLRLKLDPKTLLISNHRV
ncbi:AAA family ATPase [bacterium]|nr:AAA family ATPase [bacterium]